MCAACIEYTKDKLNISEFKSALKETTMENQNHFREVDRIIREYGNDPKELKKQLEKLPERS